MAFYETPRRNASDSTTASSRSTTNRGHRREHSDPCPLPSPMNVVAAGSGNVNDTRRRPATVAVAVCIGRYARIIFFMVRFRERCT